MTDRTALEVIRDELFSASRTAATRRILLLLLLPAILLAGTLAFDFVFDDNLVIFEDPLVVGPLDLVGIFTTPVRIADLFLNYYRPVITLLYKADWLVWGSNPAGFHLTNLLWHLLATTLVYLLALETGGSRLAAWLGALLFAILPAHAEALGWIQGRVDLVPGALVLLAFLALLRSARFLGHRRWAWATAGGVFFLVALLAKESAAALVLVVALWLALPTPERDVYGRLWRASATLLPLLLAGVAYALLRRLAVDSLVTFRAGVSAPGRRLEGLLAMFGEYISTLAAPDLSLRFHHNGIPAVPPASLVVIGGLAGCVILALVILAWRRRLPALGLWAAWIPLTLSPVLFFVFNAKAPVLGFYTGERFLYLPSAGWAVLAGMLFARAIESWPARAWSAWGAATAVALALGYGAVMLVRLQPWADPVALYAAALAQPNMSPAIRVFVYNDLGRVYIERGEFTAARRALLEAIRLDPTLAHARNNLGVLLIREGRSEEARPWLEAAIRLDPHLASAYGNLATVYEALGNPAAARRTYEAGLRMAPDSAWLAERLARLAPGGAPR